MTERTCCWCGTSIAHRHPLARYCDEKCAKRAECQRDRAKRRARTSAWIADNPDYQSAWAQANVEKRRTALRQSYQRHQQRRRRDNLAWEERNPGAHQLRAARRRALLLGNVGYCVVTPQDWRRLQRRFEYRCAYCRACGPMQQDHVVPLSRGGRHAIGNLLPACGPCNRSKSNRLLVEWRIAARMG